MILVRRSSTAEMSYEERAGAVAAHGGSNTILVIEKYVVIKEVDNFAKKLRTLLLHD